MKPFKLLLVFLSAVSVMTGFEVMLGQGMGKLSLPSEDSDFAAVLPYSVLIHDSSIYLLDPFQKKVMVLDPLGVLLEEITLDLKELAAIHPVLQIQMNQRNQLLLLSGRNAGFVVWDLQRGLVRQINQSDGVHTELVNPGVVRNFHNFYFAVDLILQKTLIYSGAGNLLGSIVMDNALDCLPVSPNEMIVLRMENSKAQLDFVSMAGNRRLWYSALPMPGDEHVGMKLIGRDDSGNIYVERYGGKKSGLGVHMVQKLNPLGGIEITARVEVTPQDSLELSQRFVLVKENLLYQLHLQSNVLLFKGIRLQ